MRTFLWVATLMVALVGCGDVIAQSCGTVTVGHPVRIGLPSHYQYSTTFHPKKEVIVKEVINEVPVAFPVLVPSFQYQYVPPCCTPTAGQPVAAAPVGAHPVATPPAQHAQAGIGQLDQNQIRALARLILAELKKEQEDAGPDAGPPAVIDAGPGVGVYPGDQTVPVPAQPVVGNPNLAGLTLLHNKCAACHTGTTSKGRFMIFNSPGQLAPNFDRHAAAESIRVGQMPHPSRPDLKMTSAEKTLVRQFLLGN